MIAVGPRDFLSSLFSLVDIAAHRFTSLPLKDEGGRGGEEWSSEATVCL